METTLLVVAVTVGNIACFYLGAKVGQKVVKGEEIKAPNLPSINPLSAYREHKERQEVEKEKEKLDKILENLDRYDGTSDGQKNIE